MPAALPIDAIVRFPKGKYAAALEDYKTAMEFAQSAHAQNPLVGGTINAPTYRGEKLHPSLMVGKLDDPEWEVTVNLRIFVADKKVILSQLQIPRKAILLAPNEEERKPKLGVAAIITRLDVASILMGERNQEPNRGKLVFPGGGVRWGESIDDALKRELMEECGIEVDIQALVNVTEIISPGEHRVILLHKGFLISGVPHGGHDLLNPRFYTKEELGELKESERISAPIAIAMQKLELFP